MMDLQALAERDRAAVTKRYYMTKPVMLWYLASPYSKYPHGQDEAWKLVCLEAGRLIAAGVPVFSPIAHTHPIATYAHMDPLDHTIWMPADEPMMLAASGLIVLHMAGWQYSHGMKMEIQAFRDAGKPIVHMHPGAVPHEVLPEYIL